MSEKVHIPLKCPDCGRVGTAVLREPSDPAWMRGARNLDLQVIPLGFKPVSRASTWYEDLDFVCIDHDTSAVARA